MAKETIKSRENNSLFINLSYGNKKLKSNKKVAFLIWNLPAIMTCPCATDECKQYCYARKAEKQYPSCLISRQDHFEISKQDNFVERMIYTIDTELMRPSNKSRKIVFRIHESGDFYNKVYVAKWLEIMSHYEKEKRIVFVAYTKSVRFFDGIDLPANFKLLASVWSDTKKENLEIIKRNNFRIYTAFNENDMIQARKEGYTVCRCDDCATCGKCWNNRVQNIACEIH